MTARNPVTSFAADLHRSGRLPDGNGAAKPTTFRHARQTSTPGIRLMSNVISHHRKGHDPGTYSPDSSEGKTGDR